jgi:dienelactone hydrolase
MASGMRAGYLADELFSSPPMRVYSMPRRVPAGRSGYRIVFHPGTIRVYSTHTVNDFEIGSNVVSSKTPKENEMKTRMLLGCALLLLAASQAMACVAGKEVSYSADGVTMKGYLAYDDQVQGRRPGVLVVHEWWGLNDYARKRARMLAKLGYTALAVDMYGGGRTADHPEDAGKFSGELRKNMEGAKARFEAAMQLLKDEPTVDPENVAAIGYCFGGGVVMEMARMGLPLDGVASFHGTLGTDHPAEKGKVKAKVLVMTGGDDPFVPKDQVKSFEQEMAAAGVDYKLISYPGAKHSFTNPGADEYGRKFNLPLVYDEKADKASWAELQAFFAEIFK